MIRKSALLRHRNFERHLPTLDLIFGGSLRFIAVLPVPRPKGNSDAERKQLGR